MNIKFLIKKINIKNKNKFIQLFYKLIIFIAIIFIIYKIIIDIPLLKSFTWIFNYKNILLSFLIYTINLLLTAFSWALVMKTVSGFHSYWNHIRIYCVTNVAQRLPTLFPYLSARSEAYVNYGIPPQVTLTAMAMEISITIVSAAIVAGVMSFYLHPSQNYLAIIVVILLLIPISIITFPNKFIEVINKIIIKQKRMPLVIKLSKFNTFSWVALFILIWLNSGLFYYLLINSINNIPKEKLLYFIFFSALSGLVGWIGQLLFFMPIPALRQITMIYLMSTIVPMPLAVAFTLFSRVCVMVFELMWATIFTFLYYLKTKFIIR